MDDYKLLQESNLTVRQPRRATIPLHVCSYQRHRIAEGLVNHTGSMGFEILSCEFHASKLSSTLRTHHEWTNRITLYGTLSELSKDAKKHSDHSKII